MFGVASLHKLRPAIAVLATLAASAAGCGGTERPEAGAGRPQASTTVGNAPSTTVPGSTTPPTTTAPTTTTPPTTSTTLRTSSTTGPAAATEPFDAALVAREIVEAESAIRSPQTPDADLAAHARAQQRAYRRVAERPERLQAVMELVPPELDGAVEANVTAGRELRALTKPRAELPAWRIVAPPPAEELRRYYEESEASYGAPWEILAAIHLVETRMGRIRGTSSAGARGPMQFMPATWAAYGEGDIEDARDSILAAGRYLKAHGVERDLDKALFAYNHSNRYVRAVRLYSAQIEADERLYLAYHQWQVYVITTRGDVLLEEGYGGP